MAIINPNGSLPVDILSGAGSIDIDAWQYEKTSSINALVPYLFRNNEQGFAYDINDLSTLFQDAAGTIPVTGAGQPVGLVKDKSGRGNHAYQTNAASRPLLQRNATTGAYYLAFDGTDDFLVTNNIDFTATDKISLFAGVRKLSDDLQIICELSSDTNSYSGSFYLVGGFNVINGYTSISGGTTDSRLDQLASIEALAPDSAVITVTHNIANDLSAIRRNGLRGIDGTGDKGLGNFSNYPLYIGRRAGTSLPFNGHLYSLIGVARLSTDAETTNLEKAIAKNVGVKL